MARERCSSTFIAVSGEGHVVGLHDDPAVVTVHNHGVPPRNVRQERPHADHGGNLQRLGNDRRMPPRPPDLGDEAEHEAAIQECRFAGSQVVGQDDDG